MLMYAIKNGIIDTEDIQDKIMKSKNQEYLNMHEYEIWFSESNQEWRTYVKDESTKRGIALKRRKNKEDLEELIITYYKDKEEKPTIKTIFNQWVNKKIEYGEILPQSATRYENDFERFFSPDLPISKMAMIDIDENELESFIKSSIKKHKLTIKTYGGLRLLIRGVFKFAKKQKQTTISMRTFFDELDLPRSIFTVKVKPKELEVYSEEELPLLKAYLESHDRIRDLGVLLTFETGLRVGELAGLEKKDISKKVIHVQRTEVHYNVVDEKSDKKSNVCEIQPFAKSDAGNRHLIITEKAEEIIKQILELSDDSKYLFSERGERIKSKGFSRALERACKQLNIPYRPMHKIRKTYGTTLIDNNVSEALVAEQLGHADISTTKKFYYFNNQSDESRRQQIEQALAR